MKKLLKILGYSILILFLLIQLYPRPAKNTSSASNLFDISSVHSVPSEVREILKRSCNDCHSNNTHYPWYSSIQPLSLWLNHHIEEGKENLNFSEFGKYAIRKQYRKLEEINEEVEEQHMPLSSYSFVHRNSKLSTQQKELLLNWVVTLTDSIKQHYPPDSLKRMKR